MSWIRARALHVNLTGLAVADGLVIAALAALGSIHYWVHRMQPFWLDGEHNFPSTFSAALLVCAAVMAVLVAREYRPQTKLRRVFLGLAGLFAFMTLDEFEYFHEHINDHFDFPWQVAYAPILVAAAYLWITAWREMRARTDAAGLWIAAAAAWAAAQVLDLYQTTALDTNDNLTSFRVTVVIEEGLEMIGSSLFIFALIVALRSLSRPGAADGATAEPTR
jgi:hypothetical protein